MNGFLYIYDKKNIVKSAFVDELLGKLGIIYGNDRRDNEIYYQFYYKYEEINQEVNGAVFSNLCVRNKVVSCVDADKLIRNNNFDYLGFDTSYQPDGAYLYSDQKSTKIITDFIGIEQLYFFDYDGLIIISTRMRLVLLILIELGVKLTKNKTSSLLYLAGRESKRPNTFFNEVNILESASVYEVVDCSLEFVEQYRWVSDSNNSTLDEIKIELKRTLSETIKDISHLRVVNTLSGGVDSQTLALAMKSNKLLDGLTVGYTSANKSENNDNYDETSLALEFSRLHGLNTVQYLLDAKKKEDYINPLRFIYDRPAHDMTSFYKMSEKARELNYDCIVSGIGGDAFFSPKRNRNIAENVFNVFGPKIRRIVLNVSKMILGSRGPINILNSEELFEFNANSFEELLMMSNSQGCLVSLKGIYKKNEMNMLKVFFNNRVEAFDKKNHGLKKSIRYHLLSIEDSPGESHAILSSSLHNMRMIMPFVRRKFVTTAYQYIDELIKEGREGQKNIFSTENSFVLNINKSGFSTPYDTILNNIDRDELFSSIDKRLTRWLGIDLAPCMKKECFDINEARLIIKLLRLSNYYQDFEAF